MNTCEVIEMTKNEIWNPHLYSEYPMNKNDYGQLVSEFEDKLRVNMKLTSTSEIKNNIKEHDSHFLYPGEKSWLKMFNNTSKIVRMNLRIPMRRHVDFRNPILQ